MSALPILAWAVLPESLLHERWYAVLSGFVAINTILYVSLSIFKIMPKLYLDDLLPRRGRRAETRSIHPTGQAPLAGTPSVPAGREVAPGVRLHPTEEVAGDGT